MHGSSRNRIPTPTSKIPMKHSKKEQPLEAGNTMSLDRSAIRSPATQLKSFDQENLGYKTFTSFVRICLCIRNPQSRLLIIKP